MDGTGVYFELLKKIYPDAQFKFDVHNYHRALNRFQQGESDLVIGVFREDIQRGLFPRWFLDTESPITAYYKPERFNLKRMAEFQPLIVSWIRGYKFDNFIPYVKTPYLVNNHQTGFAMLASDRIDVFIDYPYNLPSKQKNTLESMEIMSSRHLYVAFQRNRFGAKLAEQFDQQMQKLRDNGDLEHIFGKFYKTSGFAEFDPNIEKFSIHTSTEEVLINNGEAAYDPIEGKVLRILVGQIDEYDIELKYERDRRLKTNIQRQCYSNKLKTPEREQHFIFSKPMALYLGLRLYSHKPLSVTEPVELASFVNQQDDGVLGVVENVSYTEPVDQQIKEIFADKLVIVQGENDLGLKAFTAGRVDYVLAYPSVMAKFWQQHSSQPLFSYSLAHANSYNLGHIMCPKGDDNQKFIRYIDQSLSDVYSSQYFYELHLSVMDDSSQKSFEHFFNEAFIH